VIRYPNRPTLLFDRARTLGDLLHDGEMSWDSVVCICHHMAKMDNSQDQPGLEVRLCWTAADHAYAKARKRWQIIRDIRNIVQPLLAANADKSTIESVVGDYNEAHGNLLSWDKDLFPILRDEVKKFHARSRWHI
jgi:hypothetical protein